MVAWGFMFGCLFPELKDSTTTTTQMIATTSDMSPNQEGESPHLRKGNQDEEIRHARKGEKLADVVKPRATMGTPSS